MFQKRNKTCHRKIIFESSSGDEVASLKGDEVASLNFNDGQSGDDDL